MSDDFAPGARRLVVWGAGELGGRVARRWVDAGGAAVGFTAGASRHEALRLSGVSPRSGPATDEVCAGDVLLLALPGTDQQIMAVDSLRASAEPPARVVLVSSTGFYGSTGGVVNEETRPGTGARSGRVAALEVLFRSWAPQGVVLRMGGLYRKGRGPLASYCRRGTAPEGPPDKTLALIHYDDAAATTTAALSHASPAPTYVCVVPPCPTRRDFYQAAAVINDLDPPFFTTPLGRPPAEYDTSRMRKDLLPEPAFARWQAALVP